jgi:hypothetical protein
LTCEEVPRCTRAALSLRFVLGASEPASSWPAWPSCSRPPPPIGRRSSPAGPYCPDQHTKERPLVLMTFGTHRIHGDAGRQDRPRALSRSSRPSRSTCPT